MDINFETYQKIGEYYNLQIQLDDALEEAYSSSEILGCDCGCGGDSTLDYTENLEEEIREIEGWFEKNNIKIELDGEIK